MELTTGVWWVLHVVPPPSDPARFEPTQVHELRWGDPALTCESHKTLDTVHRKSPDPNASPTEQCEARKAGEKLLIEHQARQAGGEYSGANGWGPPDPDEVPMGDPSKKATYVSVRVDANPARDLIDVVDCSSATATYDPWPASSTFSDGVHAFTTKAIATVQIHEVTGEHLVASVRALGPDGRRLANLEAVRFERSDHTWIRTHPPVRGATPPRRPR